MSDINDILLLQSYHRIRITGKSETFTIKYYRQGLSLCAKHHAEIQNSVFLVFLRKLQHYAKNIVQIEAKRANSIRISYNLAAFYPLKKLVLLKYTSHIMAACHEQRC